MTDPTTVPIIDADDCDVNARFVNNGQNGKCVCNSGFVGDGFNCEGIAKDQLLLLFKLCYYHYFIYCIWFIKISMNVVRV